MTHLMSTYNERYALNKAQTNTHTHTHISDWAVNGIVLTLHLLCYVTSGAGYILVPHSYLLTIKKLSKILYRGRN